VHFAADLLYRSLLESGEPVKASEAARLVAREDVDLALARVVLATNPDRFTSIDRKWTLWTRFANPERAVERNLEEILDTYGLPITAEALGRELAAIYKRPVEVYVGVAERLLANPDRYFATGLGSFGFNRWLLDTESESEVDVLFDNFLKASDVTKYAETAEKLDADKPDTIIAFLDAAAAPVANKALQFLLWRNAPDQFDAVKFFTALLADGRATYLSSGTWIGPKAIQQLTAFFPAIAAREVDEHGDNRPVDTSQPLTISDEEREQIIQTVLGAESSTRASRLLEDVFEVTPKDIMYEGDMATVLAHLQADDRIEWLGADRFVPKGAIPGYVYSVPENLHFPNVNYLDANGDEADLLLEDDGFDGGLQRESLSPLAQDVLDEELAYTPDANPAATARCVLKFHHKEIGTFPLCQLPAGFFPAEPKILQVDLTLPTGQKTELYINNETRLLYGLLDWYETLPVDSGAVFYLERQTPDQYALTHGEETEPAMFISRNRINELVELGQRAETEELPTFDILREIMEHYRKGIEYITLLTEANISRRTTRRMVASLLSGYHCFFQRGGAWVYDAKKLSQGFDKSKRKYLKK
jgi:hypothetical protein